MKESMSNGAQRVLSAAIAVALIVVAASANAGVVSGVYTSPGGTPLGGHQLHFENRISGDIFLVRTAGDGSFSSDLPRGVYDLRAERGLVLKSGIRVDGPDLSVGHVTDGAPLDVRRPFERQGIGPAIVDTEAPATAHLAKPSTAAAPANAASPAQSTAAAITPISPDPESAPPTSRP
jgi:hypothetical protein